MSGKPGKRGGTAKAVEDVEEPEVARRLGELKATVARAALLIAGLREANHALKGEVAELSRKVASLDAAPPRGEDSPKSQPAARTGEEARSAREHGQLELLLQERKAIRKKIENLLERVGRLES